MAFTYFFRDLQTLDIIVKHLVPFVSGKQKIKIWDAGCASGQEPYTLAILLAEEMNPFALKNVKIYATDLDISNQFGEIIRTGIYPYQELQRIPKDLFEKYFIKYDNEHNFQISKELRHMISFKREDLLTLQPVDNDISLVLCKNVLLHQTPAQRVDIIKMFYNTLSKGGFLAMEHTQKLPDELRNLFEPVVSNAQIYKKL